MLTTHARALSQYRAERARSMPARLAYAHAIASEAAFAKLERAVNSVVTGHASVNPAAPIREAAPSLVSQYYS